ncbi:hypothetical protein D7V86_06460 [bacterium D16-51]|nr:hypothetical protein D7V96_03300 [bacterium D16-59]RKI61160.1 hypothetical protein D7V86_06460 [bacterium D16-51]
MIIRSYLFFSLFCPYFYYAFCFLLQKNCKVSPKEGQDTPCNITAFRGTNCLAVLMLDLCAFPQTRTMQQFFKFAERALLTPPVLISRSPGYYAPLRVSCSESVPLSANLKTVHTAQTTLQGTYASKPCKAKFLLKSLCCLKACPALLFGDMAYFMKAKKQKHGKNTGISQYSNR